jgi:hypothetical protein
MTRAASFSLVRHPPKPDDTAEKQANADFAKAVLSDFGQILSLSIATGVSVHRTRLAKLRELSDSPAAPAPDF